MISIKRSNSEDPDFKSLTYLLDSALCELYGTKQEDYEEYNKIINLNTIVVAYSDGTPIGCGCFKQHNKDTIEIKRMYVLPENRRAGVAFKMLNELELWGESLGNTNSILETGKAQIGAIAMYKKMGYMPIAPYNEYDALEISCCFRKNLKS